MSKLTPINYLDAEGIKQIGRAIPKIWSGTKAEWEAFDKTALVDGAIVNITDDYNEKPIQVEAMPDNMSENTIVQYIGTTTSDYINGYFYKYISDEAGALSWKNIPVMQAETFENKEVLDKFSENDEGKVLYDNKPLASDNLWSGTKAEYDAITDKDSNKTYVITDEEPTLADYVIDDTTTVDDKTWSSKKIDDEFIHNLTTLEKGWLSTTASVEKTATKNGFLSVQFRTDTTARVDVFDDDINVWSGDQTGATYDNYYTSAFIPVIKGHKYKWSTNKADSKTTVYNSIFYS